MYSDVTRMGSRPSRAIQRYSIHHYTAIHRYTLQNLYITPLQAARRAAAELGALREQSAAEAAARVALEGAKTALSKQLAEAQRLCAAAGEECARVRKRNEQVERQLAAEAERRKATGVDQVLDDLEQLEGLVGRMPGEGIVESKRDGGRVPSFM